MLACVITKETGLSKSSIKKILEASLSYRKKERVGSVSYKLNTRTIGRIIRECTKELYRTAIKLRKGKITVPSTTCILTRVK